jgi:hypothetical protein
MQDFRDNTGTTKTPQLLNIHRRGHFLQNVHYSENSRVTLSQILLSFPLLCPGIKMSLF